MAKAEDWPWSSVRAHLAAVDDGLVRVAPILERVDRFADLMRTDPDEAGFRALLAMSTYHQIQDGTAYPAVLFTAGMNDNRVAPWISFKTFARMSAASASGKPVLLRVETAGGHGVSSTAEQRNNELADRLAFILWNTGDPGFQPTP